MTPGTKILNAEYFIKNMQQTCMVQSRVKTKRTTVSSNIKYNEIIIIVLREVLHN